MGGLEGVVGGRAGTSVHSGMEEEVLTINTEGNKILITALIN